MSKNVKRLFTQFNPTKYLLELSVDDDAMTFEGSVEISGHRKARPSQRLTFHQKDLIVTSAVVTKHDKKGTETVVIDRINHHKKFDEVRLHSKQLLYPGEYTIKLEFKGNITRQMNGVYPCFFESKGKNDKLIATQFESHHAREVFPCIDEPEAKAVFELALTHPARAVALSNTPVKKANTDKHNKNLQTTIFEPTPIMSTYLLAFVYGDMGYKEAKTRDGVVVRTYATPDNVKHTEYALSVAVKCLEFYNDYFGIDYPLAKCDLIALPDFASGAMENWGCITFREQAMLVDPKNTSLSTKQYVALVVAHELTHQWFGNLVTMRWWTDLWLNEGFASWMEYLAIDHLYPDWQMWTQFGVDEQQQALKLDALEHTHPIEVAVKHPDEIRTIFDTISYSKGASAIHMLHDYLGKDDFQKGLSHYLKTHKYKNTDTIDLWNSLEKISGKPVREFMHAWTTQSGFPLVSVHKDGDLKLTQTRFFTNPSHSEAKQTLWPVPLLLGNGYPDTFDTKSVNLPLNNSLPLKLNAGQSAFYRTKYDANHLKVLGNMISKGELGPLDRLGLLSDLFETAKAGYSNTADALEFLSNFSHENNFAVWDIIASSIGNLRLIMDDEGLRESMKPYISKLCMSEFKRLGWDKKKTDSHFDQLLRPIIIGLLASADEPSILKQINKLFDSIDPDKGPEFDPDLRGIVFGTIARFGSEKEFEKLLQMHNSSMLSEERNTIASALTGFKQTTLIERALNLIDTDTVRLQDVAYWIAYSFMNRHAKEDTWKWMKLHWDWLNKNLGSDLSFSRMPIYAARVFSNPEFITEYQKFFGNKLSPAFDRPFKQGLEMIQWQSAWKARDLQEIKVFFKTR